MREPGVLPGATALDDAVLNTLTVDAARATCAKRPAELGIEDALEVQAHTRRIHSARELPRSSLLFSSHQAVSVCQWRVRTHVLTQTMKDTPQHEFEKTRKNCEFLKVSNREY